MKDGDDGDEARGYYRKPAVYGDRVVFSSEDDLWEVPLSGGQARRLTTARGSATGPHYSPDGSLLAFTGTEEGAPEAFVMHADGGPAEQLTYNGHPMAVVGWTPDGERILFRSTYREPFGRPTYLYSVPKEGGEVRREELGQVMEIDHGPDGDGRVLGRHADDLARWKRYRGGTAGTIWVDPDGDDDWHPILPDEEAGLVDPLWIGDRIYFISDRGGHGNLYSCELEGSDVQRHTDHTGFYPRFADTDGDTIVYTRGGALWRFDPDEESAERVDVEYPSSRTNLNRKFVDAAEYLDGFGLHPEGHSLAITTRGKLFNFGNWEGAVRQNGARQGVRYRAPRYLDEDRLLVLSDAEGDERVEIHSTTTADDEPERRIDVDVGRPHAFERGPEGDRVAVANDRNEIIVIDVESGDGEVLDQGDYRWARGLDWSPDGRWLAWAMPNSYHTAEIRIADVESGEVHTVTSGRFGDSQPVFDPEGRYLYFLSRRDFDPVFDQVFHDLSFPRTMKPCVVTLTEEEDSLFHEEPRPLGGGPPSGGGPGGDAPDAEGEEDPDADGESGEKDENGENDEDGDAETDESIDIDFEGIEHRVETFPVREGTYDNLAATAGRVFWTYHPVEGALGDDFTDHDDDGAPMKFFSLKKGEENRFAANVSTAKIGPDGETMALWSGSRLRVVATGGKPPAAKDTGPEPSRETGWIDLSRVSVSVEPRDEWEQMLAEAWRTMRDHYWREDMAGVDWDAVWDRYSGLLDRVGTRDEFSDLVWTMQGELGTSHAYEIGGDYEIPPQYRPGFLAVDGQWDDEVEVGDDWAGDGGYRIDRIVRGATWEDGATSPFDRPGIDVEEGDAIVAIDGRRLDGGDSLQRELVHKAGDEVDVAVARDGETTTHTVETLRSERRARYLEWVRRRRERVHEASDGELGYVHIPDMGPRGFSEFHRTYASEQNRTGLVVDVRNNGGGFVSELILERLAREQLGYDVWRWGEEATYPKGALEGPLVAVTNEFAGSDGDIFSHAFKLMELGPLVGKRTWGGVVGIWPRVRLVDNSMTTQPEFGTWFNDVEYGLENYGTDPDVEVEQPPGAEADDEDPQLERAIELALEELEENPPEEPDLEPDADLSPPDEPTD